MKTLQVRTIFSIAMIFFSMAAFGQSKETRDVADFSAVGLGISGDLYFTQGSPQEVVIQADEGDLEKIITEVKNGVLHIRQDRWTRNLRNVTIWVTAPEVEGLHLSGSGKIIAEKNIRSDEIELKVSGSGNIKVMDLEGDEVDVALSGSGGVELAGSGDEMGVSISGSGSVNARNMNTAECSVRISGSGNCQINVTGELDARISGSGSVTYFGNPVVDAAVSGSGRVRSGS